MQTQPSLAGAGTELGKNDKGGSCEEAGGRKVWSGSLQGLLHPIINQTKEIKSILHSDRQKGLLVDLSMSTPISIDISYDPTSCHDDSLDYSNTNIIH